MSERDQHGRRASAHGLDRPFQHGRRGQRDRRDGGQVLPLVALILVAAGVAALGLGKLGGGAVARAQARTAADMAALAGATGGRGDAESVAKANGARLVSFQRRGDEAWVKVAHGRGAVATARARRLAPEGGGPGTVGQGGATAHGLVPALQQALARAGQLLGRPVPITSGYRSTAEQARLWERRASNPYPVARPGTSAHERGRAVDVPRAFVPALLSVARAVGLCQPYPNADPVHFELCA